MYRLMTFKETNWNTVVCAQQWQDQPETQVFHGLKNILKQEINGENMALSDLRKRKNQSRKEKLNKIKTRIWS